MAMLRRRVNRRKDGQGDNREDLKEKGGELWNLKYLSVINWAFAAHLCIVMWYENKCR